MSESNRSIETAALVRAGVAAGHTVMGAIVEDIELLAARS